MHLSAIEAGPLQMGVSEEGLFKVAQKTGPLKVGGDEIGLLPLRPREGPTWQRDTP